MNRIFNAFPAKRIILLALIVATFTFTPLMAFAQSSSEHEMDMTSSSQMTADMIHQHVRDCAAACGITLRTEERRVDSAQKRVKKLILSETSKQIPPVKDTVLTHKQRRTAVIKHETKLFLKTALLRL